MRIVLVVLLMLSAVACRGAEAPGAEVAEVMEDLLVDGRPWLRTMITPHDASSAETREITYKVYTHILDFAGEAPITKGPGGKYSHHRGLFIGWNHSMVRGERYDTWHMSNSYQEHVAWLEQRTGGDQAKQAQHVRWYTLKGEPIIDETRVIAARKGEDDLRIVDFSSSLISRAGDIALRGDSHHAGMQVRLANEVAEHEETTQYILPEGAKERANDEVFGGWWVCCSAVVRDKRYWIIHMTPPNHPTGQPVYSIRRYARFGAFFEPDLKEDQPLDITFRVIVSEKELDRASCQRLYDEYAAAVQ